MDKHDFNKSLLSGSEDEFVISRGIQNAEKLEEKVKLLNKLASNGKIDELKKLAKTNNDSGDYGGIHYKNTFRANNSLFLLGCAFFGPHKTEMANYVVSLKVCRDEGKRNFNQEIASFKTKVEKVEKQKMFWVTFPKPVYIAHNEWHQIYFQLDGPSTGKCKLSSIVSEIDHVFCGKLIKFHFQIGSLQMPQLKFKLNC